MSGAAPLRDIRGLDPAPWWPPAPGWWVVMAVGLVLMTAGVLLHLRWRQRREHWRQQAARLLGQLSDRLEQTPAREAAGELCELLRRIAMVRFGRSACAGLAGEAWLEAHDPQGFPWRREGRLLIELPYASPHRAQPPAGNLTPLVRAAESWLDAPPAIPD